MGFCLFNNVAVAARHALDAHGLERVFVLDWDVHHGNGTNDIFHATHEVLFASLHQSPLYPGHRARSRDVGAGAGEGYTINLPVPPGSGETIWLVAGRARGDAGGARVRAAAGAGLGRLRRPSRRPARRRACCETSSSRSWPATCARSRAELGVPRRRVLEGGYDLRRAGRLGGATLEVLGADDPGGPRSVERDALVDAAASTVGAYWSL